MTNTTIKINAVLVTLAVLSFGFMGHEAGWRKITTGLSDSNIQQIFINLEDGGSGLVTTERMIYVVRQNNGKYALRALKPQLNKKVNSIFYDNDTTYFATDEGLFVRHLSNYHFNRVFSASDELQRQCLSVSGLNGMLFLGTRKGLFFKEKESSSWQAASGELLNASVSHIVSFTNSIYVLGSKALYRFDPARKTYQKIFSIGVNQSEEMIGDDLEESVAASNNEEMMDFLAIDSSNFYLATRKGVFYSYDAGSTWTKYSSEGLPDGYIKRLLVIDGTEHVVLAATEKGVYRYARERWEQMYQGLESNNVADLARDFDGNIYAATDRGLFMMTMASLSNLQADDPRNNIFANKQALALGEANSIDQVNQSASAKMNFSDYADIEQYFQFEPTIQDVHRMAIHYAEVHPDKIKKWRQQARMRAVAPTFSAGLDRSATEMFHWDTGANPDMLVNGKEYLDWDMGVSWNLGDLIWNNDQTSIDSRSKLMVELREDILDQVTRIYFERRRLQIELISNSVLEVTQKIEQQMRIAELTAVIDGFTGGKFSRQIQRDTQTAYHKQERRESL